MTVKKIPVESWADLVKHQRKEWIFRGQRVASWPLETTLERMIRRQNGNLKEHALKVEKCLLREFVRRFHHYSAYSPREDDEIEWLALMQHHGAPTRFLDWTMSIYVATYFALEGAEEDCAVWAIDQKWLHNRCAENGLKLMEPEHPTAKSALKKITEEKYRNFDELFGATKAAIAPANPFRLNERLTIQKGLFLCAGDVSITFMDNLSAFDPNDDCLKKLIIPKKLHAEFIETLSYMNVDRATLFPGLDGFAASLGVYQPHVQAAIHNEQYRGSS